MTKEIISRF